jgi:hypothetical protein
MNLQRQIRKDNATKARARRKLILQQRRNGKRFTPATVLNLTSTPTPTSFHTPTFESLYMPCPGSSSANFKPTSTSFHTPTFPLTDITSSLNIQSPLHSETPHRATQPSFLHDLTKKPKKLLNISSLGGNLDTRFANATSHPNSTSIPHTHTKDTLVKDKTPKSKKFYNIGSLGGNLTTTIPHYTSHVLSSSKSSTPTCKPTASTSSTGINCAKTPSTRPTVSHPTTPLESTNPNCTDKKRKLPHLNFQINEVRQVASRKQTVIKDIPPISKKSYNIDEQNVNLTTTFPHHTSHVSSSEPFTPPCTVSASTPNIHISPQTPSAQPTVCGPNAPSTSTKTTCPKNKGKVTELNLELDPPTKLASTTATFSNANSHVLTSTNSSTPLCKDRGSATGIPIPRHPTCPTVSDPNTPSTSKYPNSRNKKRKVPVENLTLDLDSDTSNSSTSDSEGEYMDYSTASSSDEEDEHPTVYEPPQVEGGIDVFKTIQCTLFKQRTYLNTHYVLPFLI